MSAPALALIQRLDAALGGGPTVRLDGDDFVAVDGAAVVVRTSGSTSGTGRSVVLSPAALTASADATHAALSGPGQWLLALPSQHIAGVQVLVRSLRAGTTPVVLAEGSFDPGAFAAASASMDPGAPRYTSLVPTQLRKVLDAGHQACAALATFDAVLIGGSAADPALLAAATSAGVRVVTTYGMSETSGGCVYDGVPLDGVSVRIDDGRVLISGPVLASGYLGSDPGAGFTTWQGKRWFVTSDAGEWVDGRLRILGRLDDVVITGGVNVQPAAVEQALAGLAGVQGVCVVGVPDSTWGQMLTAVVQTSRAVPALDEIRAAARDALGAGAQVPRAMVAVPRFPLLGPGKPDRRALERIAAEALAAGSAALADGTAQRH